MGHNPRDYDAIVIKTPHAQPEMFDDWSYQNIGVDCPGAPSSLARWSSRGAKPKEMTCR